MESGPEPGTILNTSGEPTEPRQAATVIVLRGGAERLEVLMVQRTPKARFMGGVWVFPGGAVDEGDGEDEARFKACAVRELEEEAGIALPAEEELVLFSRWITPEVVSRRFDAWFFLALAPPHTPPRADGVETTEARWFQPQAALAACEAGELVLSFPTRTQLGWLAEFGTSDEALAAYRERTVKPILPKVVEDGAEPRVVLPGDPDYPA
jgi:8-oxo-dGTP pyrophosphatase MutT (NUDIX family)